MSLRARLVLALAVLFVVGMVLAGLATTRAFTSSELARLDEQLVATLPVAQRELVQGSQAGQTGQGQTGQAGQDTMGTGRGGRFGTTRGPVRPVVIASGTYAELRGTDGQVEAAIQAVADGIQPDLATLTPADGITTVGSLDADLRWRAVVDVRPDGRSVALAVPMDGVEAAIARLVTIQVVAGLGLLVALGAGAWVVLRAELRPLERIAGTARSITSGSLDQRIPTTDGSTEVTELATALNTMLDDLERAFQDRAAAQDRLRRFVADASHELRTPLTSIQGYAELYRLADDPGEVDLDLVLGRIEVESGRMRELVEDLLALARLEEGAPLTQTPVDVSALAADACASAAALDPDAAVELDAPEARTVVGDPRLLRRAIGNLVSNAVRHTPPGTRVEVTVRDLGASIEVEVRDHGPGIDPALLPRVFDRFVQGEPSRSASGSGLGLSIVQAVATEHGGRATAANAPDGGAVLTLRLPTTAPA
ncbi:MAG: sensor histidine kinase [Nitriliruptoraceae bacterium]